MSSGPKAPAVELSPNQESALGTIVRTQTNPQNVVRRAKIILNAALGKSNQQIAQEQGLDRETVSLWRTRWLSATESLVQAEEAGMSEKEFTALVMDILSDAQRSVAPQSSVDL